MYNDFYKDLEDGKRGEKLVYDALAARGHKITDLSDDATARYNDIDLLLDNGKQTATLEIKNDMRSETSGNVFIETYNIKNVSHSCKGWFFYCAADYIAFVQETKKIAHIVKYEEMQQAINTNKYRVAHTATTDGYLLPIGDIQAMQSYFCLQV